MMQIIELWKDVEDYDGQYQVNNFGEVRSFKHKKPKILKQSILTGGYSNVWLCKDGKVKIHRVHRLVAQAFIPNPLNLPEVNHKDENKENNNLGNLEWCDGAYNRTYGTRLQKISQSKNKKVLQYTLDMKYLSAYDSVKQAINNTGVSHIASVCRGNRQTAGGYKWEYTN